MPAVERAARFTSAPYIEGVKECELRARTADSQTEHTTMPRGDKSKYTDKQKRMAEHIEEGYENRGVSDKESERRAWATVNKETGGGKKAGGSGQKKGKG